MPKLSPESDAEYFYQRALREAEKRGAAHAKAEEFTETEKEKIKEEQKKMREVIEWKSNRNKRNIQYVMAAKDPKERMRRIKEVGIE